MEATVQKLVSQLANELKFYKARVVEKMPPGDDRLRVRIMPHMADIENMKALPKYPSFFSNEAIVAKTEMVDKDKADFVWVLALPDFTVGYILGPASFNNPTAKKHIGSYNFKGTYQALSQRGVITNDVKYEDLYVTYWNDEYIELANIKKGDRYFVLSNGTLLALTRNQIFMRVGADSPTNKFSAIRMSEEEISFATPVFRVKADKVILGDKGLHVVATAAFLPAETEGTTLNPQLNIKV
jgi:hypothetical protein